MAAIQTLLNPVPEHPVPEIEEHTVQLPSPSLTIFMKELSPAQHGRKKQKLSKDAAVFNRGSVRGECRYPPCELRDEELTNHHRQFGLHPMGEISIYPRHIPYNSGKKTFLEQTGREGFDGMQSTIYCKRSLTRFSLPVQFQVA